MNIGELYFEIEKIVDQNAMIDLFGAGSFEESHFAFNKMGLWLLRADKPTEDGYKIDCLVVGSAVQPRQSIENYQKNFGIVESTARNIIDSIRRSLEKNRNVGAVTFTPLVFEDETYGLGIVGYSFEMNVRLPRKPFKPSVKKKEEPANEFPTYELTAPFSLSLGDTPLTIFNVTFTATINPTVGQTASSIKAAFEAELTAKGYSFSSVSVTVEPIPASTNVSVTELTIVNSEFDIFFASGNSAQWQVQS